MSSPNSRPPQMAPMTDRRPSAVLGLVGACCIMTAIFVLQGVEILLETGVADGRMGEILRTRSFGTPMLLVPCQERGCEQDMTTAYHITLRHVYDGRKD